MAVDTHELKERLIASDHEFRDLSTRHHELDERLHELSSRHFLTEPEQLEEVQIKKQKLGSRTGWKTSCGEVRSDDRAPPRHRGTRRDGGRAPATGPFVFRSPHQAHSTSPQPGGYNTTTA